MNINPTEEVEQIALFRWAEYAKCTLPELSLMYHIPNEGKRSRANGASLCMQGLKSGVPDICLPVAKGGYNALYIEMKRLGGKKPTANQTSWILRLNKGGNLALVCYGWEVAKTVIEKYLKGEIKK